MGMMGKAGRAGYHVYRSRRWAALRLQAKRRDGFRCTACGAHGRLEVHHKVPVRQAPERAYNLENLTTLCPGCHIRVERGLPPPTVAQLDWRNLLKQKDLQHA